MPRKLRVFLCHASQDKPAVRELYARLKSEPWIDPWLDEENLLPGQDLDLEIYKATRDADAIIICLSKLSVAKEGYVNKQIRRALDIAQEKPEGMIYVIPLRLDDCTPSFEQLKKLHWVDYFTRSAHAKLLKSLLVRADALKITVAKVKGKSTPKSKFGPTRAKKERPTTLPDHSKIDLDLYRFIKISPTEEVPYSFYIGKYPVTNVQYERFLNAPDFAKKSLWVGMPKFNESCIQIGRWESEGWDWLQDQMKNSGNPIKPEFWDDKIFGINNPENPMVGITWFEANAYCNWLKQHWERVAEGRANAGLIPKQIRLPLDLEWSVAAGGEEPQGRLPWDTPGRVTRDLKEIIRRANVSETKIGHTTPVNAFLRGVSTCGVMDMAGNVWEWQANYKITNLLLSLLGDSLLSVRGGSWELTENYARVSCRHGCPPNGGDYELGFRVVVVTSGRS